jgi:hypothetical protein
MTTPRSRHAARLRASRRRRQARARRILVGLLVLALAAVTLALTAFDGGEGHASQAARIRPAPLPVTATPPAPHVLAVVSNLRIQSPIAEGGLTAVGFHAGEPGTLTLQPVGPQANEGLLARLWRRITGTTRSGPAWYQLEGGPLGTLDAGAVTGTDVYAPVDGTVVAIRGQVVSGRRIGDEIEVRPTTSPSLIVSLANIHRDPALTVGANVASGSSKLGTVANLPRYEEQSLARYAPDRGNNVAIQVFPSAALGA